jgi:hypothetical protein
VKIPPDAIIPPQKITDYLLRFRPRNDKSRLLGRIGFAIDAPQTLETAIRLHASEGDAKLDAQDVYGEYFVVNGTLQGPSGALSIESIWIRRSGETTFRFVTLKPAREKR